MNVCNPSLTIAVAGIQALRTGLWFGNFAPIVLTAGGIPIPFVDAGTKYGGLGLLTVGSNNQIIPSVDGIAAISFGAGLSSATDDTSSLAVNFLSDGPTTFRLRVPFVRGSANGFYSGPIKANDVITFVGFSTSQNQTVGLGNAGVRLDLF
jgi:hypothetical protein